MMQSPMSPPPLRTTPFFQPHPPLPAAPEPPRPSGGVEVLEADYPDTEDERQFTADQIDYPMPPSLSPHPESEAMSHDSEMEDIMAIESNSDGFSLAAPSSRDSLDRLSEYRRHGPELPQMEAAAVNAFNAAHGTNMGPEMGYARPPNPSPPEVGAVLAGLGAHPEVVGGGKGKGKGKEKPKPKEERGEGKGKGKGKGKKRAFWGGGSGGGWKRRKGNGEGEMM
jgi:hypothetical protein